MSDTLSICPKCQTLNKVQREKALKNSASCGKCASPLELHGLVSEVDELGFNKILRKADRPVIVDFWAEWCGPCKVYGPTFQDASTRTDKAIFLKVNTEKSPQLAQRMAIRGIPSTIVFKEGREVKRESGALSLDHILSLV